MEKLPFEIINLHTLMLGGGNIKMVYPLVVELIS